MSILNGTHKNSEEDIDLSPYLKIFCDPKKEDFYWSSIHTIRRRFLRFFCLFGGALFLFAGVIDFLSIGLSSDFVLLSASRAITVCAAFFAALTITDQRSDKYVDVTLCATLAALMITLCLVPYLRFDGQLVHQLVSVFVVMVMYAFLPIPSVFVLIFGAFLSVGTILIMVMFLAYGFGDFIGLLLLTALAHGLGFVWLRNGNKLNRSNLWKHKLLTDEVARREKTEQKLRMSEEQLQLHVHELMDSKQRLEEQGASLVEIAESVSVAREEAEVSRERMRDAINNIDEGFVLFDKELQIIICNQNYLDLYGYCAADATRGVSIEVLAKKYAQANQLLEWEDEHLGLIKKLANSDIIKGEVICHLTTGRWIQIRDKKTPTGNIVSLHADITEVKAAEEQVRYYANHDTLTGLPSLHFGKKMLQDAIQVASKINYELAILFVDLDGFKRINDTEGHDAGDFVLKTIASRIDSCIGKTGFAARIGGDEFIVTLNLNDGKTTQTNTANQLIFEIGQPIGWGDAELSVGASIGISIFPKHGSDAETLIKSADTAMYNVKKNGKNNFAQAD